jgi:hypothetical protein
MTHTFTAYRAGQLDGHRDGCFEKHWRTFGWSGDRTSAAYRLGYSRGFTAGTVKIKLYKAGKMRLPGETS